LKPRTIVTVLESVSAAEDVAFRRALALAHWYDSDLHVLHVGSTSRVKRAVEVVRDDLVERTARAAEASGFAGVNIVPAILPGRPVRAIADYTRRVAADLVVVGSHARRSVSHWLKGSFAAALGNAVASPTITVPTGGPQRTDATAPFRTILCAIDFSEASLLALSEALVLAQQSGGRLRVLHVLNGFPYETVYSGSRAFRLIEELPARIARVNREVESLIPPAALNWSEIEVATVAGAAHTAIAAAASEWRSDLVVLGLPRRSRLEQFLAGSTVHSVLRRTTSPVLLVPGPPKVSLFRSGEHDGRFALHPSAGRLVRA
jgi:nucleotide-binding universal stress UspA family protein